jgi:4-carboxymuconolactone decarboxylase
MSRPLLGDAALDRMPPIPPEQQTPAQRAAMEEITNGPRGKIGGPFISMMRSPELMARLQKVGEYVRYQNTVGMRNSEFAVLVVARHWSNPIEWHIHRPIAEKEGVDPRTCDALAEGRRPDTMSADETILFDALEELRANRSLCDATYARVVARWGEAGVVDMVAHYGYYSTLAMLMNVARTPLPQGAEPGFKHLPG